MENVRVDRDGLRNRSTSASTKNATRSCDEGGLEEPAEDGRDNQKTTTKKKKKTTLNTNNTNNTNNNNNNNNNSNKVKERKDSPNEMKRRTLTKKTRKSSLNDGGRFDIVERTMKYFFFALLTVLLALLLPIFMRQGMNFMINRHQTNNESTMYHKFLYDFMKKWQKIDRKSNDVKFLLGDMQRADLNYEEAIETLREVSEKYDSRLKLGDSLQEGADNNNYNNNINSQQQTRKLKEKSKEAKIRLALALLDKADGNAAKSPLGFTHDKTPLVEAKYNLKKAKEIEEEILKKFGSSSSIDSSSASSSSSSLEGEEAGNGGAKMSKMLNIIEIEIALSRVYQHERDFQAAVNVLNEALEKKPSSTEARWQLAVAHQGAGDCDSALENYLILIEDAKVKHAHVFLRASMCLLHGRRKDNNSSAPLKMHAVSGKGIKTKVDPTPDEVIQAIEYLEAAVQIDASLGHAWMQLGLAHVLRNAPREAIGPLERAKKELGENSLTADFHLASAYQQANRCKEAIPLLLNVAQKSREQHERMMHIDNMKNGRAQKLESSVPAHEAFLRAGGCKFLLGEVDAAIELYREALVSSDKFAPALVNWGIALEHKEEFDKAEEKYALAVEKNPNMAEALARWGTLNLGQAQTLVQKAIHKRRAEKNSKKAWKDPEESKERKELGKLIDAAFSRLEKAANLDPNHSIAQRLPFMRQQAKVLIKEIEGKNDKMDEPWDLKEEEELEVKGDDEDDGSNKVSSSQRDEL
jgi:tetratricopeptide (TPR) repeat protein